MCKHKKEFARFCKLNISISFPNIIALWQNLKYLRNSILCTCNGHVEIIMYILRSQYKNDD